MFYDLFFTIGLTMQIGQRYSVTFPKKIHLSSFILRENVHCFDSKVEVHVVEPNGNDQLIGLLGGFNTCEDQSTGPILMCNPDINLPPGVPFTFYFCKAKMPNRITLVLGTKKFSSTPVTTQLTGYFID